MISLEKIWTFTSDTFRIIFSATKAKPKWYDADNIS